MCCPSEHSVVKNTGSIAWDVGFGFAKIDFGALQKN